MEIGNFDFFGQYYWSLLVYHNYHNVSCYSATNLSLWSNNNRNKAIGEYHGR